MSPSACDRVIAVPELCKLILLALPPKDLLLSQRINKTIRTIITETPSLQRRLFFATQPQSAELDNELPKNRDEVNELALDTSSWLFPELSEFYAWSSHITHSITNYDRLHAEVRIIHVGEDTLSNILANSKCSYMDMFLQARALPTEVTIDSTNEHLRRIHWGQASINIKSSTLREVFEMAKSLERAARRKEEDVRYELEWEWDEASMLAYDYERPEFNFNWKKFFNQDQIDKVMEKPDFIVG
ncbi:hypothetical protein CLAFUW4_13035 [Fulvia fulva]|uniref:uncharacterized protein n=1 Tax=Passalora fulva TaxID=5499 RepID=UPI0004E9A92F|nr:uncharacterized protein CLAFUR5_20344 [Fulvia fulva]KAK4611888.1 hypothetical protein CLAFUR4_13039 [Fulvia fulva]KAK4612932.1 hypothetical protein CLAFUR0_13043 [Fulvia fulva]WMI39048.1 hypothetical protein CLAFUR5_20344 [Fulvia fulva]WPV21392.1 hypothetical protein CLAFUW4_13035 [Fulvia fulva]WPV36456.1 hypothetical protein CLAFUW7_13042 [Fulvia fulva]